MINRDRLLNTFLELVRTGSESLDEREVLEKIKTILNNLGIPYKEDNAGEKIGSNANNLIAYVDGEGDPILLNAHVDTVKPGKGVEPVIQDNVIRSKGNTILGADDKAGVAAILEVLHVLKEQAIPHPPLNIVFTIAEEIGLYGAKNLDYSLINAKLGYAVDGTYPLVVGAPSQNTITVKIKGKSAHAGGAPEEGINAIVIASKAIDSFNWGRIDFETTANVGVIKGGRATNIVPDEVEVRMEVRSHNERKLEFYTNKILEAFWTAAKGKQIKGTWCYPQIKEEVHRSYTAFYWDETTPVVRRVIEAGKRLGKEITPKVGGGGSDANIFSEHGIPTVMVGIGGRNLHTTDEEITVDELADGTRLLLEIVRG